MFVYVGCSKTSSCVAWSCDFASVVGRDADWSRGLDAQATETSQRNVVHSGLRGPNEGGMRV